MQHPVPRTDPVPSTRVRGLESDSEGSRIVGEEIRLLSIVQRALETATAPDPSAARGRAQDEERMLELRDHVAVAKPEDLPALFEQMHNLGALRAHRGRSLSGTVDRSSPYFGHIRLEEVSSGDPRQNPNARGAARRRDVLIGARSYVDSGEGIRIVDWRHAPVSRIFYRYAEGDDYEETLGDRPVEGVVVARRSVSIVHGELVRVSSPQGTFARSSDGSWARAESLNARLETEQQWNARRGVAAEARLGSASDGRLRQDKHLSAIASLLDPDQFALIAKEPEHPDGGLVAIQGSAGSGKTTVGLHRIAYLAYLRPQQFRPESMFVVVPNEALVHYVSRVLPSLGVEGVPVTTFARFAARLVAQLFPRLPTRLNDVTPPVVSRAKSHAAMLKAIDGFVLRVEREASEKVTRWVARWPGSDALVLAWAATQIPARPQQASLFDRPSGPGGSTKKTVARPPDARVALLSQWLAGKRPLPGAPDPSSAIPPNARAASATLFTELRETTRSVLGMLDELLTSREELGRIFMNVPGFTETQIDHVHAWCVQQARVRAQGERDGEEPSLDEEDQALVLRGWQALRGPLLDGDHKPLSFSHLFVDEVQDSSPVELRVLLDLAGPNGSVTLAGDTAQRMVDADERGEFDWNALLDDLGTAYTRVEPLRVSYRSTAEITHFARTVLGPLAHDTVPETTRHGPPVELFQFASQGESVAWLAEVLKQLARDEPDANVALVTRFPQQADVYFDGLMRAEVANVRRVAQQDFGWEPGIDVTDVRQTKGLEFDEVILLETTYASYPTTPAARHALYVGATRASHQLWCVCSEPASELVTAALEPLPG
jgi:DNA helicase-2/ATP-dependent DNA helicase PcrA